jgi:feruloyl esterase
MKSQAQAVGRQVVLLILLGSVVACAMTSRTEKRACNINTLPELPDVTFSYATHESTPASHCKVVGVIGSEIGFELRLPDDWNGKFIMGGSGGFAGNFANAAYDLWNVVSDGWATVATDTGHKGHPGDASWALNNFERQVNFGHQAVHQTAVNAKALTRSYYGSEIGRSLFFGCSRGGGQGLMLAQRSPDLFDGIYAGAPAFAWTTELGGRWSWNAQRMYPDPKQISRPFIDENALALIGNAVLEKCDALDGLTDKILNDPLQCDFEPLPRAFMLMSRLATK